jgi:hypothetical protein
MFLRRRAVMLAAIALATVPGAIGCGKPAQDVPAPAPSKAADRLLDPDRIGDRSGNPSCGTAVEEVDHLVWRQVVDASHLRLPLEKGATVRADRNLGIRASENQQRWGLAITVGARAETHGTDAVTVRRAFATSCARDVYRLENALEMYRGWVREDDHLERFDPGAVVAVCGATMIDGVVWLDIETLDGDAYAVRAEDLRQAATRL